MDITRFFIRSMALIVTVALSVCAYGREIVLYAFAENKIEKNRILDNGDTERNYAIAETENKVIERTKMSIIRGDGGDMPFLVNGIKYNCRESGGYLCFYNSNQTLIYSIKDDLCVFYSYDCSVGEARLTDNECEERARAAIDSVFVRGVRPKITECIPLETTEKVCTFILKADDKRQKTVKISIRRDTGSVILYDALEEKEADI